MQLVRRLVWVSLLVGGCGGAATPIAARQDVTVGVAAPTGAAPVEVELTGATPVEVELTGAAPVVAPQGPEPPAEAEGGEVVEVVEKVVSDFHLAAYRDGSLGMYPMSNGVMLVVGAQAIAEAVPGEQLLRRPGMTWGFLDPGELWMTDWRTGAVGGRWPDSTWLSAYFEASRWESPIYVYYRKGPRWQRKANVEGLVQWSYRGFAPWIDGQTLALRVRTIDPQKLGRYGIEDELPTALQKQYDAALGTLQSRFDVIDPKPGAAAPPSIPDLGGLVAFTARVTGEIDAIVHDEQAIVTLLHWAPGASEARRFPLPTQRNKRPQGFEMLILAHKDGGLWVGETSSDGPYLARFDGEAWSLGALPTTEPLRSLSAGDDGELWAVTANDVHVYEGGAAEQGHLWRSEDGKQWRSVRLPTVQFADLAVDRWQYSSKGTEYVQVRGDAEEAARWFRVTPKQVWSGGGEVWVVGKTDAARRPDSMQHSREVVLRTGAVVTPLGLPSDELLRLELLDERAAKSFGFGAEETCELDERVVTFMSLPADAPKEGPIELVETLLRDHPELTLEFSEIWEAKHRGRRVVAWVAGELEKPRVAAVLALLNAAVPEKRSFACRLPLFVRPLYREAELGPRAAAYRAAHPELAPADAAP